MNARQRARRREALAAEAQAWQDMADELRQDGDTPSDGRAVLPAPTLEGSPRGVSGDPAALQPPPAGELVLVDEREIEAIRWHGYDTAIADALDYRARSLDTALDRLDRVMRGAYLEYERALDAIDSTFAAARRAAMNAHELAQGMTP